MAARPVLPFEVCVVTWEDAMTDSTASASSIDEALHQYAPTMRKTTGYFVGANDKVVVVADTDDRSKAYPGACAGFTFIPVSLVRKISHARRSRVPKV